MTHRIEIDPTARRGTVETHNQGMRTMKKPAADKLPEIDFSNIPACNATALRRAARRLGNLYDDALEPVGLKATQVGLMVEIARMAAAAGGQAPSLQDLARQLAIQISALTHALRPLVRDGLVAVQPDAEDGRAKRALLTRVGTARLTEAAAHWATVNSRVEAVLGHADAAALRALSDRVSSDEFLAAFGG